MNILEILLISLGLAMDAFAVSICLGYRNSNRILALKAAFLFGVFQAVMPIIGWACGYQFRKHISAIDHWIAFFLLFLIGIKMIYEAIKSDDNTSGKQDSLKALIILAVATSIDALAVGVTFSILKISILLPIVVIGVITFILSYSGVKFGCKLRSNFDKYAEIAGGVILIILGSKILIEHTLL